MKDPFQDLAHPATSWRKEGLPDPARVAERGILTRESLGWMEAREPKDPAPEHHIDDAELRAAATEAAREEHRARINRLREDFRGRSLKGREDFGMARGQRDPGRDRSVRPPKTRRTPPFERKRSGGEAAEGSENLVFSMG